MMKYPERFLLKLEAGRLGRIDGVTDNRSAFVRAAIEVALGAGGAGEVCAVDTGMVIEHIRSAGLIEDPPKKSGVSSGAPDDRGVVVSPRAQDKADLLALIGSKRLSSRAAKAELGWLGLRYENAERALMDDGAIWVSDGILEVL